MDRFRSGKGAFDPAAYSLDSKYSAEISNLPKSASAGTYQNDQQLHKEGLDRLEHGSFKEAVVSLSQAYAACSTDARYAADLARAERLSGDLDSAQKHCLDAISLGSSNWEGLAIIYALKGEHAKSVACLLVANRNSSGQGIDGAIKGIDNPAVHQAYVEAMARIWPNSEYAKEWKKTDTYK